MRIQSDNPPSVMLAGLLGCALLCASPPVSRARAAKEPSPTVLLLAPRGQPAATRSLVQAVKGQLSDVAVRLQALGVARLPANRGAQVRLARSQVHRSGVAAVCWYDPRTGQAHVLLRRGSTIRLVSRTVGKAGAQGHYDAAAITIRTTIRGHLKGEGSGVLLTGGARPRRGTTRPASRPPNGKVTRPIGHTPPGKDVGAAPTRGSRRAWRRLELVLWYALDVYAPSEAPVAQGPRLDVLVNLHLRWAVYLGYRFDPGLRARGELATLDLSRHLVELGLRLRYRLGRWELGARLGLDVTAISRETTPTAGGVATANDGPDWLFGLSPLGYIGVRVHPRVAIRLAFGARVRPRKQRYLTHDGSTLLAPWIIQPTVMLGIGVDLL